MADLKPRLRWMTDLHERYVDVVAQLGGPERYFLLYPNLKMSRWIVTYTKHIKQKRKVYQDGILELSGGKVLLYNDCEKLIDSRFLKKDEVVECRGMLTFDSHLVDIGDPEVSNSPSADQNVGIEDEKLKERAGAHRQMTFYLGNMKSTMQSLPSKNNSNPPHGSSKVRKQGEQYRASVLQRCPDEEETILKEWNALYTTQITQKSKRYHDGILQLVSCGSHMNQVILLNEDRTVLSSKYLKSVECVETGRDCGFSNYLVQICEPCTVPGDNSHGDSLQQVAGCISSRMDNLNQKDTGSKPMPDDIRKGHEEEVQGGVDSNSGRSTGLSTRPIRDATQILSSLKRPDHTLQSSDIILLDVENKNKMPEFNARKPADDNRTANTIVVYGNCPGKPPSDKHSTSSNRLSRLSCGPVDNTNMDKIASPSSSPVEDHINASKNRSLTDEIMTLQLEWTDLSYRVSAIGNTKIPIRPVHDNTHAGERCEMDAPRDASLPLSVATESRSMEAELHSSTDTCLNEDEFPTFDLGFE